MDLTAVAVVGTVCVTGMISVIGISISRAISKSKHKQDFQRIDGVLRRLEILESRIAEQDDEVRRLQEDNRFLNRLLKHEGEENT